MSVPKVSVLMSVYNGSQYLSESINSILQQTFTDFEFLIINDGSTDATLSILTEHASKDHRIVLINNDQNIGLTRSLNKGLTLAQGEYIARMDADDVSAARRLERQIEFLRKVNNVGVVGTYAYCVDEQSKCTGAIRHPLEHTNILTTLLAGNAFVHGSVMFCNDGLTHYDERIFYAQDYDLWIRFARRCQLANLPEYLYYWRYQPESISNRRRKEQDATSQLIADRYLYNLAEDQQYEILLKACFRYSIYTELGLKVRSVLKQRVSTLSLSKAIRERYFQVIQAEECFIQDALYDVLLFREYVGSGRALQWLVGVSSLRLQARLGNVLLKKT